MSNTAMTFINDIFEITDHSRCILFWATLYIMSVHVLDDWGQIARKYESETDLTA